jgi:hypothetical protein
MIHHALAQDVVRALRQARLRVSNEGALQRSIAAVLDQIGVDYGREHRLSAADRPDFLVAGDIVIEAKVKYAKRSIYRQLQRYAEHDNVGAIILVSNTAMGLPVAINGKPIYVVSTGMAYL